MIDHGVGDLQTVSAMALRAGIDMDMVGEGLLTTLPKSLKEGKVTLAQIDAACRRILEAKYKLGLFEDPYRYCDPERAKKEVFADAHRKEARRIAAESFVLLKNEKQLLPLKKSGSVAIIGPLGNSKENMPGTWSVAANLKNATSLLAGMKELIGDKVKISYAKGSNLTYDSVLEANSTMFGRSLGWDSRPAEQIRAEALAIAKDADVIIAALGESSEMSGESSSRTDIGIPDAQKDLLMELLATGKPVVLVLFTGRPLTLSWEHENVPAILNVWFAGSEAGYAITDVLFGDKNPSGKLSATFPRNVGQVPIFYNHKNTGRPLQEGKWFSKFRSNYLDVPNDPLYPFGYGLSYTQFEYSDISLSATSLKGNQQLKASVTVTNKGAFDGKEVVQLYIRDKVGSVTRPVKELKGFQKIMLKAGESKKVEFEISTELLKFYNYELKHVWEPGEFEIMIGGNSRDVKLAKVDWQQ
jgi:beta-glucosidase